MKRRIYIDALFALCTVLGVGSMASAQMLNESGPAPAVELPSYLQVLDFSVSVVRQPAAEEPKAPAPQEKFAEAKVVPAPAETKDSVKKDSVKIEVDNYKQLRPVQVASPARAPQAGVQRGVSGVPIIKTGLSPKERKTKALLKLAEIPTIERYDIGEEERIRASDMAKIEMPLKPLTVIKPQALGLLPRANEKELKSVQTGFRSVIPLQVVARSKDLRGRPITAERVASIRWDEQKEQLVSERPVEIISLAQLDMLAALVLYDLGDQCHMISGLFDKLSKDKTHSSEARLFQGVCAKKMGLPTTSTEQLLAVLQSDEAKEFHPTAVREVVDDLRVSFEDKVAQVLKGVRSESLDQRDLDWLNFWIAKSSARKKDFRTSQLHAAKVSAKHQKYGQAQFLLAVSYYFQNERKKAIETLESVAQSLKNSTSEKGLRSLVDLTLGRMKFQQGDFGGAIAGYREMGKDHPLWVDALREQGWAQLAAQDYAGAIGNMHSIHGPFFKYVYKPESYVIRSIGYLNLCQYADAYRSLALLNSKYQSALKEIEQYLKGQRGPGSYYLTVKRYLQSKSDQGVDGLRPEIIREAARHKDYLNLQLTLNQKEDEIAQLHFLEGLVSKTIAKLDGSIANNKNRRNQLAQKIKSLRQENKEISEMGNWETELGYLQRKVIGMEYRKELYLKSQNLFKGFKAEQLKSIAQAKESLKKQADQTLKNRLVKMQKDLNKIIESNEILKYEIFSGSGENLRVQVARDPNAPKRTLASETGVKDQNMDWSFEGEYWEDEIGNYRSSLVDNCGK